MLPLLLSYSDNEISYLTRVFFFLNRVQSEPERQTDE